VSRNISDLSAELSSHMDCSVPPYGPKCLNNFVVYVGLACRLTSLQTESAVCIIY